MNPSKMPRRTARVLAGCCALAAGAALAQAGTPAGAPTRAAPLLQPSQVLVPPAGNTIQVKPEITVAHMWPIGATEGLPTTGSCVTASAGQPHQVFTMVRNVGNAPTGPFSTKVRFTANGHEVHWHHVGLNPGQQQLVMVPIPAGAWSPSMAAFQVIADPKNTVAELNEGNNSLSSYCLQPAG